MKYLLLIRKVQGKLQGKDAVIFRMEPQDALILPGNFSDLPEAESVGECVLFRSYKIAVLIFFQLSGKRVPAEEGKAGMVEIQVEGDKTLFFGEDFLRRFQGIVQDVHQKAAQIGFRDIQMIGDADLRIKADGKFCPTGGSVLEDGIDGGIFGKGYSGALALFTEHLVCLLYTSDAADE